MKIRKLMTTEVATCKPTDSLNQALRPMWDADCGFVLVTDPDGGELRGVLTDRDACMAAYTRGLSFSDVPVDGVMRWEKLHTCSPDDDVATAHEIMRKHQVRRLPVVEDGRAVGVVSLNDLATAAVNARSKDLEEVGWTLAAVCRHREPAGA
jgi:CBS domain-containing protein